MMRLLFAVSCLCCWAASVQAQTLLVLGDSLSAGYQMQAEQSWPALLNEKWQQQGGEHTLINASISGETTQGGLARLPALLETHKPDWVLIELGANDGLRGLKPQLLADNLGAMIDAARDAGAHVLLVGMRMPPNYGPDYTRGFEQNYSVLAKQYGTALLPFLLEPIALDRNAYQADNLHPVASAQPKLRDHVWKALEPLLR